MSGRRFVSEAIEPAALAVAIGGEPQLPPSFTWRGELLEVKNVARTWRSTKEDRGDVYLKRHWFEFESIDGRVVTVYFDRAGKRGQSRWWLYSIGEA